MDPKHIEQLLEKYFEGESTRDEEIALRRYFNQAEIADDLRPYQPLFRFFEEERSLELGADFDEKLLARLEMPRRSRVLRLWPVLTRVAAVVILALGIWLLFPEQEQPVQQHASIDWSKYEPQTQEEAYRITRTALLKASGKINEGAETAAREIEKVKEIGRFIK